MVGAPSTNRCGACKARKVKCDEAWPVCGPCKKGQRSCPGPPAKPTKFIQYSRPEREIPIRYNDSTPSQPSPRLFEIDSDTESDFPKLQHMVSLRITKKSGGTFRKIRLTDLASGSPKNYRTSSQGSCPSRSPSLTPGEELSWRFYNILNWDTSSPTPRVHLLGMWHPLLLQRLGENEALDNVTLLMISSHDAISRGEHPSTWFDLKQYGKSLRSLQHAIDDPKTRFHINTLAAIALIYRSISGLASTHGGIHKQAVHARALVQILRIRGIRDRSDPLEFFLAIECQIASAQDCISQAIPEPCIFDAEEWDQALHGGPDQSGMARFSMRMYREMVKWTRILNSASKLSQDPEDTSRVDDLLHRTISIAVNLEKISYALENELCDPRICTTRKSADPLVPIVYEFRDMTVAPLLGFFCLYSINVNKFIMEMSSLLSVRLNLTPAHDSSPGVTSMPLPLQHDTPFVFFTSTTPLIVPLSEQSIGMIQARCIQLCQKIWMMCEQVRTWKPLGGLFLLNPLRDSFSLASPEMKKWIVNAAVDIESPVQEVKEWSAERMRPKREGWKVY